MLLDEDHDHVHGDGDPDLILEGILGSLVEGLEPLMLFDLFEK